MTPKEPIDIESDYQEDDLSDSSENIQNDEIIDDPYDDTTLDQGEIYDENWDEEEVATSPVAPEPRKKKSSLTVLLIGGAVVIGGGLLAYQMAGKSAPPVAPVAEPANAPEGSLMAIKQEAGNEQPNVPDSTVPEPAPATQGFMDNPQQLEQQIDGVQSPASDTVTPAPVAPAQPAADTPSADMTGAPPVSAPPTTTPEQAAPVPAQDTSISAAPSFPSINEVKKAPSVTGNGIQSDSSAAPAPTTAVGSTGSNMAPAPLPTTTSTATTPAASAVEPAVPPLQEPPAVTSSVPDAPAAAPVSAAPSPVVPMNPPESDPSPETEDRSKISSPMQEDAKTEVSDQADTALPKATPSKPAVKKPVIRKKTAAPAPKWELRGARPGEAMIAKTGQASLTTIHVGDIVSGIGEVRSIGQTGGKWVVQGTTGKISQ